ncbi:hypothetical protein PHYSODRAFT_354714 [Phytophthora sojae]|uniref:Uncharacterized protein n=1 Tax=Phytophthora sojae (strain P6497) TaxID=1094619 RepID=G4ZQ54_PHYSP|nr:hypothetical protein PHYSODRAFT_354714 [Phytophthora sojae]EGZ14443.1 hypothetical protein PHYSODRAFT_354714 [Phytophthora sojae]|eukprot:XP_009528192.1 hypothetical protein PHYSODRAFT_354714 [Phytophthora sojae]
MSLTTSTAMDAAAVDGHLDIVKYLHELQMSIEAGTKKRKRGTKTKKSGPLCTTKAMDGAASNGHLHVVQWLHHNREEGCTTDAMDVAAAKGHLQVAQWLHEHRSEMYSGCYGPRSTQRAP